MNYLEVTWWRATQIWWSMLWRSLLFTSAFALPLGVLIGAVGAALHVRHGIFLASRVAGMFIGVPVGIWVTKLVMEKQFGDFQILLAPSLDTLIDEKPGVEPDHSESP